MATITMRDLVRDSKRVFDALEADRIPMVVTRNGRPFAALMPIDQEQAESLLLASNPEVAEMQRKAEQVIANGGARSLSDALNEPARAQGDDLEPAFDTASEAKTGSDDVSVSIAKTTEYITEKAINSVTRPGLDSRPDDKWAERIRELNSVLVEVSYLNELKRVTSRAELSSSVGRRMPRRKKAENPSSSREITALESARKIVYELNSELVLNAKKAAPDDIEETFESELRGGVLFAKLAGFSPGEAFGKEEGRRSRSLLKHH
jgi:antitoxin (DNA-binding transcriptional repressor) of toxin-antitoxin stability system